MHPSSLYGRGHGAQPNQQRDSWGGWRHSAAPDRGGIVSLESLAPKLSNREQELRRHGASSTGSLIADHPSLTRTVRSRLSQAFGRFTEPSVSHSNANVFFDCTA
ncbi:uncharacterized protein LOC118190108 [Stegodyphus dumicola]|uniref:uncharacterized protein LOC118190108 n=1 Tax=Stegodyphus dumicola TaxID=202533 RepID=UPI0015B0E9F4|nr:uncharacterized protein LOC118190108 [Stegodyphus dumicola]